MLGQLAGRDLSRIIPNLQRANWKKFRELLNTKTTISHNITTVPVLEAELDLLTENICKAAAEAIPNKIIAPPRKTIFQATYWQ